MNRFTQSGSFILYFFNQFVFSQYKYAFISFSSQDSGAWNNMADIGKCDRIKLFILCLYSCRGIPTLRSTLPTPSDSKRHNNRADPGGGRGVIVNWKLPHTIHIRSQNLKARTCRGGGGWDFKLDKILTWFLEGGPVATPPPPPTPPHLQCSEFRL